MTNDAAGAWQVGDNLIARGEPWTVLGVTAFSDCAALKLEGAGTSNARRIRTLLVPFDRPVRRPRRELIRVGRGGRWLHELRRLSLRMHAFGALRGAAASGIRLLPYQLEPALAICRGVSRVLIADDVGLGKTIQAGLIVVELAARADAFRALVLAPAGLIPQWSRELRDHFDIRATVADAAWLRAASRQMPADVNPWSLDGVYLASVDFSKRAEVLKSIEDLLWDVVVVDEAHGAGPGTDRRDAVNAIARRARRVVLLTATPDNGEPGRMDDLCGLGEESERPIPITVFRRLRSEAAGSVPRRTRFQTVRPTDQERQMHRLLERYTKRLWIEGKARGDPRARLVSIVLRKRGLSSASSLAASARRRLDLLDSATPDPAAQQLRLPIDDDGLLEDAEPDAVLGAPGLGDAPRERRWLAAIIEAALYASRHESKAARLTRLLSKVREPVIVFTEYRDTLARLARSLSGQGPGVVSIHGGMDASERDAVVRKFNEECLWLLATDAAAEGLNLHARCRIVIHYELPWSPTRLEQRCGRVDRMGQTRRVHEIALIADDTAESLVLAPLGRRIARAWSAKRGIEIRRLNESRVADAIVGGAALHMDAGGPTARANEPVRDTTLRAEAVLECRRLLAVRRFIRLSLRDGARPPEDDVITVSRVRSLGADVAESC